MGGNLNGQLIDHVWCAENGKFPRWNGNKWMAGVAHGGLGASALQQSDSWPQWDDYNPTTMKLWPVSPPRRQEPQTGGMKTGLVSSSWFKLPRSSTRPYNKEMPFVITCFTYKVVACYRKTRTGHKCASTKRVSLLSIRADYCTRHRFRHGWKGMKCRKEYKWSQLPAAAKAALLPFHTKKNLCSVLAITE